MIISSLWTIWTLIKIRWLHCTLQYYCCYWSEISNPTSIGIFIRFVSYSLSSICCIIDIKKKKNVIQRKYIIKLLKLFFIMKFIGVSLQNIINFIKFSFSDRRKIFSTDEYLNKLYIITNYLININYNKKDF